MKRSIKIALTAGLSVVLAGGDVFAGRGGGRGGGGGFRGGGRLLGWSPSRRFRRRRIRPAGGMPSFNRTPSFNMPAARPQMPTVRPQMPAGGITAQHAPSGRPPCPGTSATGPLPPGGIGNRPGTLPGNIGNRPLPPGGIGNRPFPPEASATGPDGAGGVPPAWAYRPGWGYHQGWVNGYWHGQNNNWWGNGGGVRDRAGRRRHRRLGNWLVDLRLGLHAVRESLCHGGPAVAQPVVISTSPVPSASGSYDYSQPLATEHSAARRDRRRPGDPDLRRGPRRLHGRQLHRALQKTDEALKTLPNDAAINEFRALCLFALKQYDQAAATLYAVLSAGPGLGLDDARPALSRRGHLHGAAAGSGRLSDSHPRIGLGPVRAGLPLPDPGAHRGRRRGAEGGPEASALGPAVGPACDPAHG